METLVGTRRSQAVESKTSQRLSQLGTVATFVGATIGAVLLLAALAGITFGIVRYVSERSYRTLWEMENIRPFIAPK